MKLKKVVWFEKPDEKETLNELAEKYKDESSLALAIQDKFQKDFSEAMVIAEIWLNSKK